MLRSKVIKPTELQIKNAAKKLHTDSEAKQKKIFSQRGYGGYHVMPWDEIKPGYYMDNLLKSAETMMTQSKRKRQ